MESETLKSPRGTTTFRAGLCAWALLSAGAALAGTLSLGTPTVQGSQYTFPVYLRGEGEGVAALDFRLGYDPTVFSPVSVQPGPAALSAQKQISSNVAEPGEYIVVLMGFNQNTVEPGAVAEVVLQKIGNPESGQSELLIAEPTMATSEGVEIDSAGTPRVVRFDGKDEAPAESETPAETPESADPGEGGGELDSGTGNGPSPGGIRFIVAEETEHDRKKNSDIAESNASPGAPGGAGGPNATTDVDAGDSPGAPARLPNGSPSPALGGSTPSASLPEAGRPGANELVEADTLGAPADGAVGSRADTVPDPGSDHGNGNGPGSFVILLAMAAAIPTLALVLLKILR